jgi:hypothetical protein
MTGQAYSATTDDEGNVYATGYLRDTVTGEEFTQTVKIASDGTLFWGTIDKHSGETDEERGNVIAVSGHHVFVCSELTYYDASGAPERSDYYILLYSTMDGSIVYDTLIDANHFDITYDALYDKGHFYLLGRSYFPSSNSADYRYKMFKFGVEEPSSSEDVNKERPNVRFHPNPLIAEGTLTTDGPSFESVSVFNANGQLVRRYDNLKNYVLAIERGGLPAGLYLYAAILGNGKLATGKITIQ